MEKMIGAIAHRALAGGGVWCDGAVGLAQGDMLAATRARRLRRPLAEAESKLVVGADARIDNAGELVASLGIDRDASDAELILAAYERWGSSCVKHLIGDFAFVVWDGRRRELFCARDPMGVRPLYYFASDRLFAFASEIKALFTLPDIPRDVDGDRVARFLGESTTEREATLFRGIRRLPAAHTMTVAQRASSPARYWRLDPDRELRLSSDEAYAEAFRDCFAEAVRCRLRGVDRVGSTLSGGLDSSSIVCMARQLNEESGTKLHTFSLVFPHLPPADLRLIDERAYVGTLVRGGGLVMHSVRGDALSPMMDLDRVLWHLDGPHPAPNLYLHWGMYRAAQEHGVRVLLDGLDGDSAVSHGFARLNGLLRSGDWNGFEHEVRAYAKRREIAVETMLRHYGYPWLAALARGGHFVAWVRGASELSRRFSLGRRSLALGHGLRPLFSRRALSDVRTTERQAHIAGIEQPLYQLALELADHSAAAFGIEPRYPFFDRRLIELCVSLPAEQKFANGWSRYVFRRAMAGILPPEIQWRATKSNLSPNFFRQLRDADLPKMAAETFDALEPYVRPGALRALRARFVADPRSSTQDDGLRLFRASVLATWLSTGEPHGQSNPRSFRRSRDRQVPDVA
jgi:asparagine synthase (glutamine-hydrolysing)